MKGEKMRQEKIILSLVVVVIMLSIFLFTGIGYAVETDNLLIVNESNSIINQTDFEIAFARKSWRLSPPIMPKVFILPSTIPTPHQYINLTNPYRISFCLCRQLILIP